VPSETDGDRALEVRTFSYNKETLVTFDKINLLNIEPFENGTFVDELTSDELYPEGVPYLMTYLTEDEDYRTSDIPFEYFRQHEPKRGLMKGQLFAKKHMRRLMNFVKVIQVNEYVPDYTVF
jgi:hypothetical protein